MRNINPGTLTALTLLIAESRPEKKDQMTALGYHTFEFSKREKGILDV